ncbi:MAG: hypothetical protein ACQERZ_09015 [Fusobacteriota bacterium]
MKDYVLFEIVRGDVCDVKAQALITAVDSGGLWCGQVDEAIRKGIGSYYHDGLINKMKVHNGPFWDGEVVIIEGDEENTPKFKDIIFVIDDFKKPLHEILEGAINKAIKTGYKKVILSAIRTGESFGKVEKSIEEVVNEVKESLKHIYRKHSGFPLDKIKFIAYNNREYEKELVKIFKDLNKEFKNTTIRAKISEPVILDD